MISADVIEKYQTILRHNPASQVFAPLADAYLERGLTLQAEDLAKTGTERHPTYPAGFLVIGKVFLKQEKFEDAERALQKCIELSPQNILAHQLLGDCYLAMKNPLEALKAYKMTLFLNPYSAKARKAVEKLESASALEFEEDTFAMAKLSDLKQVQKNQVDDENNVKSLKPILQLVDAFLIRGDKNQAAELLKEAQVEFGSHPDLEIRMKKISSMTSLERLKSKSTSGVMPENAKSQVVSNSFEATQARAPSGTQAQIRETKLKKLYGLLRQVRLAKMAQANP